MELDKPQLIVYIEHPLKFNAYDVKWIPRSCRLAVMGGSHDGKGTLQILEMSSGKLDLIDSYSYPSALKCGTFRACEIENRQLATGDFSGNLQIFDLNQPAVPVFCVGAHNGIVNCIDGIGGLGVGEGAAELVTGGKDSAVRVWDPRTPTSVVNILPDESTYRPDCWAVAAGNAHSPNERAVAAGFDNGDVKIFDLRTCKAMFEINLANGVCSLEFDRRDIPMNKLVITTLESRFHVLDLRSLGVSNDFATVVKNSHDATVWCVKHLPQNREIWITTGGNGTIQLHKYDYPPHRTITDAKGQIIAVAGNVELLGQTTVSTQPVTSFDWSCDRRGLGAFTAIDETVRVIVVTKLNHY